MRTRGTLVAFVLLVAAFVLGAMLEWEATSVPPPPDSGPSAVEKTVVRRELRPTLPPARFSGTAAHAYQVARDMPEVLDQLPCYCACRSEYGHVSLLSCYVDGHAAT